MKEINTQNMILCVIPLCFRSLGSKGTFFPSMLPEWSISGNIEPIIRKLADTISLHNNNEANTPPLI